ncbi:hypothetical protein EDB82DRAFT_482327 [Fusarium venenatum]|uniref:uncharacterized protein n=1 Tax=Fusarium venenatum TaxID=56646 RepID=UPI001D550530|nr:hypothetical protein EDB82DRAFT_482327 [Fusarium venenatum]
MIYCCRSQSLLLPVFGSRVLLAHCPVKTKVDILTRMKCTFSRSMIKEVRIEWRRRSLMWTRLRLQPCDRSYWDGLAFDSSRHCFVWDL